MAKTTADKFADKPSTAEPGDAPADTVDPDEHVSSVTPDKAAAAQAGHLTVNAAVKVDGPPAVKSKVKDRTETYEAVRPDGTKVKVTRNIETGESKVK